MFSFALSLLVLLASCAALNIVLTNDDGWVEANIRAQYTSLVAAGNNVVLCAPALNESGTGSSDAPATVLASPCEFNSCPVGSPAEGFDASNPRFNYVNSFPVTTVRFGIQQLSKKFFGALPDLVVSGPNVGNNTGFIVPFSGTVGAATEATLEGIPAVAFSGVSGTQEPFTVSNNYSAVYAALATRFTSVLTANSRPFLPRNISLNVNFPALSSSCQTASHYDFVLSRINTAASTDPPDVFTCESTRLPDELTVITTTGCHCSVSVFNATTKLDVGANIQAEVMAKISSLLTCL